MIGSEKLCEGNLSTSLLEGLTCSDAARSSSSDIGNSDCENRAKRENGNQVVWKRRGGSWVSHVPLQKMDMKLKQVRRDDQSRYHNLKPPSSLGSGWNEIHCPPAYMARKLLTKTQNKQKEVLHLCRWSTHTPRCREAFSQMHKR